MLGAGIEGTSLHIRKADKIGLSNHKAGKAVVNAPVFPRMAVVISMASWRK